MARIKNRTIARRFSELQENQWLSKLLFQELPIDSATEGSQMFLLRREVRGDGIILRPIRITFEQAAELTANIYDEGNAFTQHLPNNIYDEGDANETYTTDEFLNEGGA